MTDLLEKQYELGGVVFGLGAPIDIEKFKPEGIAWRTQDGDNPTGDHRDFGRDLLSVTDWGFELYTNAESEEEAYEFLAALEAVWRAPGIRDTPQAVMPLRFRLRGRERIVFVRPGRWSAPPDNASLTGYIPITCDVRRVDTLFYSVEERSLPVGLTPSTVGGLTEPLMDPLQSLAGPPPVTHVVEIGGTHPTWITVEFAGEMTEPKLEVAGWVAKWDGSMPYDQKVTIDPRPWKRNVMYKTGGSAAGKLNRRTHLDAMLLAPGEYTVQFSAAVAGGSATATLRWRDADSSL